MSHRARKENNKQTNEKEKKGIKAYA